jgi:hypothetical protein
MSEQTDSTQLNQSLAGIEAAEVVDVVARRHGGSFVTFR